MIEPTDKNGSKNELRTENIEFSNANAKRIDQDSDIKKFEAIENLLKTPEAKDPKFKHDFGAVGGKIDMKKVEAIEMLLFDTDFQDLPDELTLKVLRNLEPKDLISCGQASKRLRKISYDNSLWQRVNLSGKKVKSELLELILNKECKSLNLYGTTILGSLSLVYQKSKLKDLKSKLTDLNLSISGENIQVSEKILATCCSLEKLVIERLIITPKMATSICQNGKSLKVLNIYDSISDQSSYSQIIKSCQELKEVDLALIKKNRTMFEFVAENISPNIENLNLSKNFLMDNHISMLVSRCTKITALHLGRTSISDISLTTIRQKLSRTLEEFSLYSIDSFSSDEIIKLNTMPRLRYLNFQTKDEEEIKNLTIYLPRLAINQKSCFTGFK